MEKNALLNHEVVMASSDKTTNNFISKMKKRHSGEYHPQESLFHPWRAVPRCRHESS